MVLAEWDSPTYKPYAKVLSGPYNPPIEDYWEPIIIVQEHLWF